MPDLATRPTSTTLTKLRVAATSAADLVLDLALPPLVYAALAPTGLSPSVRLSVGGFFVAGKAIAGHLEDPSGDRRRLALRFALAAGLALLCTGTTLAVAATGLGEGWSIGSGTLLVAAAAAVAWLCGHRRVDGFALLVLVEVAATVVLTSISSEPRFVLARPSVYTAIAGVYALATVRTRRPLMMRISKPMAAAGDAVRADAFERAGRLSPRFRRAQQAMTAGLGVVLLAEAVLRLVVVADHPAGDALLAQLPAVALIVGYVAVVRIAAIPVVRREVDALMPAA